MFQGLNALIWLSYSYFYLFDPAKLLLSHGVTYDLASKEGKLAVAFMKSMGKMFDPSGVDRGHVGDAVTYTVGMRLWGCGSRA